MEDIITLEFKDGKTVECEIRGVFDCQGKDYIALDPLDGSDDIYVYGYKENKKDGTYQIFDIEDEEEFKVAVAEFDALMA